MWEAQARGKWVTQKDVEKMEKDIEKKGVRNRPMATRDGYNMAQSDMSVSEQAMGKGSDEDQPPQGSAPSDTTEDIGRPPGETHPGRYYRGREAPAVSGRYWDSELPRGPCYKEGHTDSEADADTEEQKDKSIKRFPPGSIHQGSASSWVPPPDTQIPPMSMEVWPSGQPPHGMRRRKFGPPRPSQRDKPPSQVDAGPIDFQKFGVIAQIWMERLDQKAVERSKSLSLTVTDKPHNLPKELSSRIPPDDDDDVFLPPQWVIARGRHGAPLFSERGRASGGASDSEGEGGPSSTRSSGRQMLLFFKVGGNWKYLAWVLFDEVLTDAEIIRMVKDIQLKHPGDITKQVHNLMQRWWKKMGPSATIEELRYALEFVSMPYIQEEHFDQKSSITSFTDTEEELDIDEISEKDPNVTRLLDDYGTTSKDDDNSGVEPTGSRKGSRPSSRPSSRSPSRSPSRGAPMTISSENLSNRLSRLSRSSGSLPFLESRNDSHLYEADFEDSELLDESIRIVQPKIKEPPKETNL